MGKGSRNRLNREVEPEKEIKKKVKRARKPLSTAAKRAIAGAVCLLLVAGIVFGSLVSAGTFKRNNILVHSKAGSYDLDQQTATFMLWDACYYQAYVQWMYLKDTITSSTGISDEASWCLLSAQSGVQETLLTTLNTYADTLREYIAVCDFAVQNGISLSKEEKKTAREEMATYIEDMASSLGYSTKGFINYFIGCKVKMKDIEKAAEIQALCQKVYDLKQTEVEAIVDADTTEALINKYVKDNPESFYSTDYYVVKTENATLKDALLAATTPDEFKTVMVKDILDNNFHDLFNKYPAGLNSAANELLNKLKGKSGDELTALLAENGMEAKVYASNATGTDKEIYDAIANSSTKGVANSMEVVSDSKAFYTFVVTKAIETNGDVKQVTAAVKVFEKVSEYTYKEDANFKDNFYKTILAKYDLYEKAEGDTLYTDDESLKDMITEVTGAVDKVFPAIKTQAFVKEAAEGEDAAWEEGSYQEWMFKGIGEDLKSVKGVGAVTAIAETKEENGEKKETGAYNVYMIVEPMKLDDTPLVNGGYIKFSGEGHDAQAQAFLDLLKKEGVTGEALAEKFSSYTSPEGSAVTIAPNISESISEAGVSESALAIWLFDEGRTANDTIKISVADDASKDGDSSCTYVAFYLDRAPTWKSNARSGYINEQISDWVEVLIADYELTGTKRIKDKTPAETEAETEAETDEHGHAAH